MEHNLLKSTFRRSFTINRVHYTWNKLDPLEYEAKITTIALAFTKFCTANGVTTLSESVIEAMTMAEDIVKVAKFSLHGSLYCFIVKSGGDFDLWEREERHICFGIAGEDENSEWAVINAEDGESYCIAGIIQELKEALARGGETFEGKMEVGGEFRLDDPNFDNGISDLLHKNLFMRTDNVQCKLKTWLFEF